MKNLSLNLAKADVFSQVLLFLALASAGVKWIPIINVSNIALEVSNIVQLMLIFLFFPILLKRNDFIFRSSFTFNYLLTFIFFMAVAIVYRSQSDAVGIVRLSLFSLLSSYVLVNIDPKALLNSKVVVPGALASFILLILISFYLADKSFLLSVYSYFITFDRSEFLYGSFRPALNAFNGPTEMAKAVYLASNINPISSVFALLFILSGALSFKFGWPMFICAIISLSFALLLFSLSAVLICALVSIVYIARYLRNIELTYPRLVIIFVVLAVTLIVSGPLISFGYSAVVDNAASNGHRIWQYAQSLQLLNETPFWGPGYILIDGHQIHNLFFFSWISGGVLMCLGAIGIYLMAFFIMFEGIYGALIKGSPKIEYLLMAALPILFLVRCSVGGAGGLPVGSASLAVALAVLARKNIHDMLD
jgi:hypothetical protein